MSTVTLSTDNPRSLRAVAIAATSNRWIRCTTRDGRKVVGVPSSSQPDKFHIVSANSCDCKSFEFSRQACQHLLAFRLAQVLGAVQ